MNARNWAADMAVHTTPLLRERTYGPVQGICKHCGETCGEVMGSVHLAMRLDADRAWSCFTVTAPPRGEPAEFVDLLRALENRVRVEWVEL